MSFESSDFAETRAYERAISLYEEGNAVEASKIFLTLVRDYPYQPHVWNYHMWAGFCFYRLGDSETAIKHLRIAQSSTNVDMIEDGHCYVQIREYLAMALSRSGKLKEALQVIEEAEKNIGTFGNEPIAFRITKGRIYLYNNFYDDATREFESALALCIDEDENARFVSFIHYQLGKSYYYAQKQDLAGKYFDLVDLSKLEHDVHPSFHLDQMIHFSGIRESKKVLAKFEILKEIGIPEDELALTYNTIGVAHYRIGNYDKAIEAFTESDRHDPVPEWILDSNAEYRNLMNKSDLNLFIWLKTRRQVDLNFSRIVWILDTGYFLYFLLWLYIAPIILFTDRLLFCLEPIAKLLGTVFLFMIIVFYIVRNYVYPQAIKRLIDPSELQSLYPSEVFTVKFIVGHKKVIFLAIGIVIVLEALIRFACTGAPPFMAG